MATKVAMPRRMNGGLDDDYSFDCGGGKGYPLGDVHISENHALYVLTRRSPALVRLDPPLDN
ncbi:MAG TPA: hypothetical protein VL992_18080 [Tepidisphaeraceae bacterium]|nr:hypothetical protein [Tepidisphaeraceae bacterium]